MRRAYELAVSTVFTFSGSQPSFLWSDLISFSSPVSIGDILRLDSRVIATERASEDEEDRARQRVHCEVLASILRPETGESRVSNSFAFSFLLPPGAPPVREVFPTRTGEALRQREVVEASGRVPDFDGREVKGGEE